MQKKLLLVVSLIATVAGQVFAMNSDVKNYTPYACRGYNSAAELFNYWTDSDIMPAAWHGKNVSKSRPYLSKDNAWVWGIRTANVLTVLLGFNLLARWVNNHTAGAKKYKNDQLNALGHSDYCPEQVSAFLNSVLVNKS